MDGIQQLSHLTVNAGIYEYAFIPQYAVLFVVG
jgi:hypothetical protein